MAWAKTVNAVGDGTNTFDTGNFTSAKFHFALNHLIQSSTTSDNMYRLGNSTIDTGSNYSVRRSINGGAESTGVNEARMINWTGGTDDFTVFYFINISSEEKLIIAFTSAGGTAGATSIPGRIESTSNQFDIMDCYTGGSDTYSSDSDLSIFGTD